MPLFLSFFALGLIIRSVTCFPGSLFGKEAAIRLVRNDVQPAIAEGQFDAWVFQNLGNADAVRKRLSWALQLRLSHIKALVDASSRQMQTLELAGQGDIKRFFDQVEMERDFFQAARHDRGSINALFQRLQPVQRRLTSGLFNEGSLFEKVLRSELTGPQQKQLQAAEARRRERKWQQACRSGILELTLSIPLTDQQRTSLLSLMTERTPNRLVPQQYMLYLIRYRFSQLDRSRLRPLLDDTQWEAFEALSKRGASYGAFLKQQGYLEEISFPADQKIEEA